MLVRRIAKRGLVPLGREKGMKTRTQLIKELSAIVEDMKENGVEEATEYTTFKAICDVESAIEHLEENED